MTRRTRRTDDTAPDAKPAPTPKKPRDRFEPPVEEWDIYDVHEKPGQKYFFVGLATAVTWCRQFLMHPFVDLGKTVYTNSISAEFEYRRDGFALIPALIAHELTTGDLLFRQKNTPDIPGNYSLVNSSMKVIYAQLDVLWSTPINKNLEFEYGLGVGIGAVFGDLETNWVQVAPNGELASDNGKRYSECTVVGPPGTGCNSGNHKNSSVNKVGDYTELSWFINGGSKPTIALISVLQIGLRASSNT